MMSMRNCTIGFIGAVMIAVPGLVAMGGEPLNSRDEQALEKAVSELYHGCEETDGAHVYDVFIKAVPEIKEYVTRIYEQKIRAHGGTAGWQFEDAAIQKIYEKAHSDIEWMYNRVPRYSEDEIRKQFVNHVIYAMNDRLIETFSEAIWDSPSVSVKDVELRLTGNEKKITLEYHREAGKTTVRYERDDRKPALPERVVKIGSLYGRVPSGATPYFQIPKDADVVSCRVQQTGDHMFLWQVQNRYHCCAHTIVEMKDGTRASYKFWRDGQEMEYSSDNLLPQQDASQFIKVFFTVKDDEGRPSPRADAAED